jgi:diguanylate cyclase (GGDEF)-like protein/putative nucleotidyltransferase with HDIG domain
LDKAAKTILIVDDDPFFRRLLTALLAKDGYTVVEASNGLEGLEAVHRYRPPVVLSDVSMPVMDGTVLVQRIRDDDLDWYPYVLMVTASADIQRALDCGADDFISKGNCREELLPRVRAAQRILALQASLQEKNSELNHVNDQLHKLAVTDPLTGLLNRRAFFERSRAEMQRAQRYNLSLSCLLLDIDHFKKVNDTYGHPAGDLVIKRLGECLLRRFRENDILCRYGGEEFSVMLTNTPIESSVRLADVLREDVSQLSIPEIADGFRITVSIGVSTRCDDTPTEDALIDCADQALLLAKRMGRNCVVRSDELQQTLSLLSQNTSAVPIQDSSRVDSAALIPYHVVNTLLTALEFRDGATAAHSRRVATMCRKFAQLLGLAPTERLSLEIAALLHDIGKISTPDEILKKSGPLNQDEFNIAQHHRSVTVELLRSSFSNQCLIDMVRLVDNWFDGSRGELRGEAIPLGARILAIASLYDDVTQGRAWWEPHSEEAALTVLQDAAGSRLDPELVRCFCRLVRAAIPAATVDA